MAVNNPVSWGQATCKDTSHAAGNVETLSCYLQTMANQGVNPLIAIQMALSGELYAEPGE